MTLNSGEICRPFVTSDGLKLSALIQARSASVGTVIFLHGLAGDRSEVGNIIGRTAAELPAFQLDTVRFDFRGHGEHAESSRDMTIRGEVKDLEAAITVAANFCAPMTMFVAASLGAVPLMLHLAQSGMHPASLVLWNPVLDFFRTFVDPGTSWSQAAFKPFLEGESEADLGGFVVGSGFWNDLNDRASAAAAWRAAEIYAGQGLIIHGNEDQIVPYGYAEEMVAGNRHWSLSRCEGGKHGLEGFHDRLVSETVSWLSRCR